jgi:cytosine/adenosine deaminase-related metal-dependent hydrolase
LVPEVWRWGRGRPGAGRWRGRGRSDDRCRHRHHSLETGFVEESKAWLDAPVITHTSTELKTLRIADGRIAEILDANSAIPPDAASFDAQGQLVLPTFRDIHIHLDKTFYGGPWEATLPTEHGRADRVAQEREILPRLLPLEQDRTAAMVRLMHSHGTTVLPQPLQRRSCQQARQPREP